MAIAQTMPLQIGLEERARQDVADNLCRLLSSTYTLYLKTQKFHWNVTGLMFAPLHQMFETQYRELADTIDSLAERIRALGFPAPGSYTEFSRLSDIHEESGVPKAEEMIRLLLEGHETLIRTLREVCQLASQVGDEGTVDLLTGHMQEHEKTAWMLRSILL